LYDVSRSLNLISLTKAADYPVDFQRLCAVWPGPVFQFEPKVARGPEGYAPSDIRSIVECLFLAAGAPVNARDGLSPFQTLLWSRQAGAQVLAQASAHLGSMFSSKDVAKFKGSNEGSTALALKAHLARWLQRRFPDRNLAFEARQVEEACNNGEVESTTRVDLTVQGEGRYEVESMVGSGPMESFYHRKVFSRLTKQTSALNIVVPNEAVLWAGPQGFGPKAYEDCSTTPK
jgi:hypothetical protein